jgi:hypothetical protein
VALNWLEEVDVEQEKIEVLNPALKQAIVKEIQKTQNGI